VECWGQNDAGELGLAPGVSGPGIVDLGTGRHAVAIGLGGGHTCAVLDNGGLKCWGRNDFGQLGLGDTDNRGDGPCEMGDNLPFVPLGTARTAQAVVGGDSFTCALLDHGDVTCWGDNYYGQLGLEDTVNRGDTAMPLTDPPALVGLGHDQMGRSHRAVMLAAGYSHACAKLEDGFVKCWGLNAGGQLGIGASVSTWGGHPMEMGDYLPVLDLGSGRLATAVAAGAGHTCVLLTGPDHLLKCWGLNDAGQLGLGDTMDRGGSSDEIPANLPPVALGTGNHAVDLAAGEFFTCAVMDDWQLKCWGANDKGQLGLPDTTNNRGDDGGEMGDNLPAVDLGPY
jgi:alpha-tubulin suppressor-like RCC1 family protein